MSNITPNGKIKLYKGVRLDNTYQNALSFGSETDRNNFFHSATNPYLVAEVEKVSYQRVTSGVCDIEIPINQLYNVNYMAFQNTGFSNRWFYAFVKNVEYVNNITSRVTYEIDVLTTFYFDWSYLPSYIERSHTATDVAGEHCMPEPIRPQNTIPKFLQKIDVGSNGYAVVCAKVDMPDNEEFARSSYSGNLSAPIRYYIYNSDPTHDKVIGTMTYRDFSVLCGLLTTTEWANAASEVLSFFYFPFNLLATPTEGLYGQESRIVSSIDYNIQKPTTVSGYTPRNKKLLTFPYNYLVVDSGETTNQYRFEWFRHQTFGFRYLGALICNPEIYLLPLAYASSDPSGQDTAPCWGEKNVISNFPQVPFAVDSFKAWLAQTQSSRKNKVMNSVVSGASSGASSGLIAGPWGAAIGAAVGAVGGGVSASISNAQAEAEARDMANKVSGSMTGSNEIALGELAFRLYQMSVTQENARVIDDFFDRFGYAIERVQTPAIRTRPHWNYIKTNGLNMSSQNVPADYVEKIKAIHDAGVTYWKAHDEIGNYALNNAPS